MELRERHQETLKEKWRAHNQNRDFKPKDDQLDSMAMTLFGVLLSSLFVECIFWLIPRVFPDSKLIVSLIVTVITIEILFNWHRSYFDVANWVTKETKEKYFPGEQDTPQGWRNCIKCQVRSTKVVILNKYSNQVARCLTEVFSRYKPFWGFARCKTRRGFAVSEVSGYGPIYWNVLS